MLIAFAMLLGFLFLCVGLGFGWHTIQLLGRSDRHYGTVVRHDIERLSNNQGDCNHPIVKIAETEGVSYSGRELFSNVCDASPEESIGDIVPVLIPRDGGEPQVATFGDLWLFPLGFGGVGMLVLLIGGIPIFQIWSGKRRLEQLKYHAKVYTIDNPQVKRHSPMSIFGRSPFRIELERVIDGKTIVFRSHNLWLRDESGVEGPVNLYIDTRNPERYAFEVSYQGL